MPTPLDFDARYRVDGYDGIAFYLTGYAPLERDPDDWCGMDEPDDDPDRVIAVMVGDDRKHVIDVCDLEPLDDDAYCSCCGQIGCGWS